MVKVAYICDKKRDCKGYKSCNTTCFHTTDAFHTANGVIHSVHELDTDRFIQVGTVNEVDYYMEVKNGN